MIALFGKHTHSTALSFCYVRLQELQILIGNHTDEGGALEMSILVVRGWWVKGGTGVGITSERGQCSWEQRLLADRFGVAKTVSL